MDSDMRQDNGEWNEPEAPLARPEHVRAHRSQGPAGMKLNSHWRMGRGKRLRPEGWTSLLMMDPEMAERRENLFKVIERTQAIKHKRVPPDAAMELIRHAYPMPTRFMEQPRRLLERLGLPMLDAFYYTMIPDLTRLCMSQKHGLNPDLSSLKRMSEYLRSLYIGVHLECFYLILLNRRGRLIRSILLQKGSEDSAPFYLNQMLLETLREKTTYVVLAHNHPGGTMAASKEDLLCTLCSLNALIPIGISMLDHVIIAKNRAYSIRASGVLPDILWTAVFPHSRIVRDWLDADLGDV